MFSSLHFFCGAFGKCLLPLKPLQVKALKPGVMYQRKYLPEAKPNTRSMVFTLTYSRFLLPLSYLCAVMETQFDRHIEALIFAAPSPITVDDIRAALEEGLQQEITTDHITAGIESLFARYKDDKYAFEPAEMAGGYQFLTKGAYHNTIAVHLKLTTKKRLSTAAMETLALIAYRQPMTRSEMEQLRGVSCDYAIQKLLEKELVYISGRSEGPGKPLLYGTSDKFMEYMGIRSMDDLPKLKDFKELENMVGESTDLSDFQTEVNPLEIGVELESTPETDVDMVPVVDNETVGTDESTNNESTNNETHDESGTTA
jgi:segregation and condensation protein B